MHGRCMRRWWRAVFVRCCTGIPRVAGLQISFVFTARHQLSEIDWAAESLRAADARAWWKTKGVENVSWTLQRFRAGRAASAGRAMALVSPAVARRWGVVSGLGTWAPPPMGVWVPPPAGPWTAPRPGGPFEPRPAGPTGLRPSGAPERPAGDPGPSPKKAGASGQAPAAPAGQPATGKNGKRAGAPSAPAPAEANGKRSTGPSGQLAGQSGQRPPSTPEQPAAGRSGAGAGSRPPKADQPQQEARWRFLEQN